MLVFPDCSTMIWGTPRHIAGAPRCISGAPTCSHKCCCPLPRMLLALTITLKAGRIALQWSHTLLELTHLWLSLHILSDTPWSFVWVKYILLKMSYLSLSWLRWHELRLHLIWISYSCREYLLRQILPVTLEWIHQITYLKLNVLSTLLVPLGWSCLALLWNLWQLYVDILYHQNVPMSVGGSGSVWELSDQNPRVVKSLSWLDRSSGLQVHLRAPGSAHNNPGSNSNHCKAVCEK